MVYIKQLPRLFDNRCHSLHRWNCFFIEDSLDEISEKMEKLKNLHLWHKSENCLREALFSHMNTKISYVLLFLSFILIF